MGVLYSRAFTQQALLDAWDEVRDRAMEDGQLNTEVEQFKADAAHRLAELSSVLSDGAWKPAPARRIEKPKPAGGVRVLAVPSLADRVVERAPARPARSCDRSAPAAVELCLPPWPGRATRLRL